MAQDFGNRDPYGIFLLQDRRELWHIMQTDLPDHEARLPDRKILTTWTSRPQLTSDLVDYVEDHLDIRRTDPNFPGPRELCQPIFRGHIDWPNQDTDELWWRVAASPQGLAERFRQEAGARMPASMHLGLDVDSTLAWYGDLHVDHVGTVFQMEAARRDIAALLLSEPPDVAVATHLAVLEDHTRVLTANLNTMREDTYLRCYPIEELVGGQSWEWTLDARVRELRTWPGGEHTSRLMSEVDKAEADLTNGPASKSMHNYDRAWSLKENFSITMSQARLREWGEQTTPPTPPSTPLPATTLTKTVLHERAHGRSQQVDHGIRREPKQLSPRAVDNAEHQRHQNRIDTTQHPERRRPSI